MQITNHRVITTRIHGGDAIGGNDQSPGFIRFGGFGPGARKFSQGALGWLVPFWTGMACFFVSFNQRFEVPRQSLLFGLFGGKGGLDRLRRGRFFTPCRREKKETRRCQYREPHQQG